MKGSNDPTVRRVTRRAFIRSSARAGVVIAGTAGAGNFISALGKDERLTVWILVDTTAGETPVEWAIEQLGGALQNRGFATKRITDLSLAPAGAEIVLAALSRSKLAREFLKMSGDLVPDVPEALRLARGGGGKRGILACGSDTRGLVYALLELADRVRFAANPKEELRPVRRVVQQPANKVRSISRLFTSEVEDKSWFYDREFWRRYLTEMATHRFNRFALNLGLGYDFTNGIRDAYLHFAYPFLVSVPGYNVRATPLPEEERGRNLEMLQFIGQETVRRGLQFQLGLWTHAYIWTDSPNANYTIEGLTPATHAPYCRSALQTLLRACPDIGGVTIRIHGESGIAEGSYEFWQAVFEGVARCGRRVEIDLHAKGIDDKMIELALATGMPVSVAPKFWAEHMGLGYMQGAIRPLEMPPREEADKGFFAKSSGSRRFLRYGYGDLLREDRRYSVLHRIWPGTQRLLLWGDPQTAADYGRASSFCGSAGVDWFEPLSFKGRKGSGLPGGRCAYADPSLQPAYDFEKFAYSYRVWGRRIYDPDCDSEEWRRYLRRQFGPAAHSLETALASAGRILPLITTAHCPSAANNNYWPEMYFNMPIVDAKRRHPYGDTLTPKRFGAVSSLDPEFFSRVDDFAEEIIKSAPGPRYSPAWVAARLEFYAALASKELALSKPSLTDPHAPEYRRLAADVAIQSGLGNFFAWKFRAAVLYAIYGRGRNGSALAQALECYRKARAAWARFAEDAKTVYRNDVTFGPDYYQRGHWLDRLPAIDADIADMEKLYNDLPKSTPASVGSASDGGLISEVPGTPPTPQEPLPPEFHVPPKSFRRGEPLLIVCTPGPTRSFAKLKSLRLRFRRVNQVESWQVTVMEPQGTTFRTTIPRDYTDSPFPLQYHFELTTALGRPWFLPGLNNRWNGQPYFVVRQNQL